MSKSVTLLSTLLILTQGALAQGPWAPGWGHGYGQFLFNIVPTYSEIYDGGGNTRTAEREITDMTLAIYSELGVSKRFTMGFNIPYILVQSGDITSDSSATLNSGTLSAPGNLSISGKYTFLEGKLLAALIAQIDLPTSDRSTETGLSTGVDATTFFPKISIGGSKNDWFAYAFFGYGFRTNNYHDVIQMGIEGGIKASEKISLILNINRWHNVDNGDSQVDSPANLVTGLYTSFQEYNAVLLKLFADDLYNGWGGFFSFGGGSGTSVAASPALSLGIFYKW